MKIIALDISRLKLPDFMNFNDTILTYAKGDTQLMEICPDQVGAYDTAQQKMEDLYQRHRKNIITPELEAKDGARDKQAAYIRRLTDAERRSLDAARVKAAEEVWMVLEDFGRMSNLSYTSQTTKIKSMCNDLMTNHLAAVEKLGLSDAITLLNQLNDEFQQLFYDRFLSVMGRENGEMADARKKAQQAYMTLRLVVCGLYEWRYAVQLTPFIKFANTVIPDFRARIGQTGGTVDKDEVTEEVEEEETDTDITTPENPEPETPNPENPNPENPNPENPGNQPENPGNQPEEDDPNMPPPGSGGSGFE